MSGPPHKELKPRIADHPFFQGLSAELIDLLARNATEQSYDTGDLLIREGDPANEFLLITNGKVALEIVAADRPGSHPDDRSRRGPRLVVDHLPLPVAARRPRAQADPGPRARGADAPRGPRGPPLGRLPVPPQAPTGDRAETGEHAHAASRYPWRLSATASPHRPASRAAARSAGPVHGPQPDPRDPGHHDARAGPRRGAARSRRSNPGQFNMLYAFGLGEVAISISGNTTGRRQAHPHGPGGGGRSPTRISNMKPGETVGVRGPYGFGWPVDKAEKQDVVVVAGGLGLAPLRPALYQLFEHRDHFERDRDHLRGTLPEGARLLRRDPAWRALKDVRFQVTVDAADRDWYGDVGLVTARIPDSRFEAARTTAFVCGPEIMMRLTAKALAERGIPEDQIWVSMERNMKCADRAVRPLPVRTVVRLPGRSRLPIQGHQASAWRSREI